MVSPVVGPNGTTTTGYDEDNLPVSMKRGTADPTTYWPCPRFVDTGYAAC